MEDFNKIYQEVYEKNYVILKKKRDDIIKRVVVILLISLVIGIVFSYNSQSNGAPIILSINIGLILSFFLTIKLRETYRKIFKENIIGTFVKTYSDTLNYDYNGGVSPLIYSNAEFEKFDKFYSEDYIYGTLNGNCKISMAEVKTQEFINLGGEDNTTKRTIFEGIFVQVKLNKINKDVIKLRTNANKVLYNKQKVEMDSGNFEKIYDIYSNDKIGVMQLFTAEIMDMFIDFKQKNKIIPELTLKDNNMYIRFRTGKVFESRILKKAVYYNTLEKYYNIIRFILEITQKMFKNIEETDI